jgi:hypothetical protein
MIERPDVIAEVRTHLGLPTIAPVPAPARGPRQLAFADDLN